MKWTKEKPKVTGWYWWRDYAIDPTLCYVCDEEVVDERKLDGGEWSDTPIPYPEEP